MNKLPVTIALALALVACEQQTPVPGVAGTYVGELGRTTSEQRTLQTASEIDAFCPHCPEGSNRATLDAELVMSQVDGTTWRADLTVSLPRPETVPAEQWQGPATFTYTGTISAGRFSLDPAPSEPCESVGVVMEGMAVDGRAAVIDWVGTQDTCAGIIFHGTLTRE